MNEKVFTQELLDYQKRIDKWVPSVHGTRFNKEENTMVKFVIPFFNMLGWNELYPPKEMEFEYFVGRGIGSADIALYTGNFSKPKLLVEVKPIQNKFREEQWPTKIFQYISQAKVKFGIATNGDEFILYDNFRVRHDSKRGSRLFSIKSKDFKEYRDILLLLSKRRVGKGDLDVFARKYRKMKFYNWEKMRNKNRHTKHSRYNMQLEFSREVLKQIY